MFDFSLKSAALTASNVALFVGMMTASAQAQVREESHAMVLLRSLPTLSTSHSVAIVELDPESDDFGKIVSEVDQPELEHPLHHLYYSPNGRLYSTGLDPKCSLAEIGLARDATGAPKVTGIECLNTAGQMVGEDIMWAQSNGTEYMFVTFMGGLGQADGGTVGVFDAQTNEVVKVIEGSCQSDGA